MRSVGGGHSDAVVRAVGRLVEGRSARFVSWVSIGEVELAEEDVHARGSTDFVSLETRASQPAIASAVLRDGDEKVRSARNPLYKLALGGAWWGVKQLRPTDLRDFFDTEGQRWHQTDEGLWRPYVRGVPRTGFRAGGDPTMVLEAIPAIVTIEDRVDGVEVHGCLTTCLRVRADLAAVDDRLSDFLDIGDSRRRVRGWYENAAMRLWLDQTGLPRRVSYAPLAPNVREPLWWTLELFDFRTPVERPGFFEN